MIDQFVLVSIELTNFFRRALSLQCLEIVFSLFAGTKEERIGMGLGGFIVVRETERMAMVKGIGGIVECGGGMTSSQRHLAEFHVSQCCSGGGRHDADTDKEPKRVGKRKIRKGKEGILTFMGFTISNSDKWDCRVLEMRERGGGGESIETPLGKKDQTRFIKNVLSQEKKYCI